MISAEILALLRDGGLHPINIIIITITIFVFGKIKPLLEWYKNTKLEKRENLEKAISSEYLSDKEKNFLCRLKSKDLFYETTGFYGDEKTRELVIDYIEKSCGKITIDKFKTINRYISYKNNELQINISSIDWVWQSTMRMIAVLLCTTTPFICIYFIVLFLIDYTFNLKMLSLSVVLIVLTLLYLPELIRYQTFNIFYKNNHSLFVKEKPKKRYRIFLPILIFFILVMINYHLGIYNFYNIFSYKTPLTERSGFGG